MVDALLAQHGRSIRWLAKMLGKNHESVRQWVTGEANPRDERVFDEMIAVLNQKAKGQGESAATPDVRIARAGIRFIPIYPGLSAGTSGNTVSDVEWLEVKDWGNEFERWGRVITGFSMEPVLEPGDIVIFENQRAESGHIVHAEKDGDDCVKVLRGKGEAALLAPINLDYDVVDVKGYEIKGIAVQHIRKAEHGITTTVDYPHGMRYRFH